jgi:hypothetical protein
LVALAGRVLDRWGGTPVFMAAAGGMLVIILWFPVAAYGQERLTTKPGV